MPEQYYKNYRLLAAAIVLQQCRDYHEMYMKTHKSATKRRKQKLAYERDLLINYSYGSYLDLDMEAIVDEIEKKAKAGEDIKWKGDYTK